MSIKSRTIDNLGIEASNQYAKNQQALKDIDVNLLQESPYFRPSIESGLTPYIPAGGEESFSIFTIGRATVWAAFSAPANYGATAYRLFTYSFIPSLGGSERLQAIGDKLESLEKTISPDRVPQHEYKTLRSFIQHLIDSSRTFDLIKSRCNQYQRG